MIIYRTTLDITAGFEPVAFSAPTVLCGPEWLCDAGNWVDAWMFRRGARFNRCQVG